MISKNPKPAMLLAMLTTTLIAMVALILILCGCCPPAPPSEETEVEPTEKPAVEVTVPVTISPVVILVIDDFETTSEDASSFDWGSEKDYCLATPNGEMHHLATGARVYGGRGVAKGYIEVPHGWLVYSELTDLLDDASETKPRSFSMSPELKALRYAAGECDFPCGVTWLRNIDLWDTDAGYIILVGVDTEGFTTQVIKERIEQAISDFNDVDKMSQLLQEWWHAEGEVEGEIDVLQPRGFVLNMSFVLLPCDPSFGEGVEDEELVDLYKDMLSQFGLDVYEFEQTLDGLAGLSAQELEANPDFAQVRAALAYSGDYADTNYESDPLFNQLQKYSSEETTGDGFVISVAAAGNSGFNFPFAPALWPSVVSVSALDTEGATAPRAEYSNSGEVAMDGQHTSTTLVFDFPEGQREAPVEGTSFAVPRLSLQAARYLLAGGTVSCAGAENVASAPPLTYAPVMTQIWEDLPLSDAASKYCQDFPMGP
jgi:hypothetical protein